MHVQQYEIGYATIYVNKAQQYLDTRKSHLKMSEIHCRRKYQQN